MSFDETTQDELTQPEASATAPTETESTDVAPVPTVIDRNQLPPEGCAQSITSLFDTALLQAAYALRHGSTTVVELRFHDQTSTFIKFGPYGLEVGGTLEASTGQKVSW